MCEITPKINGNSIIFIDFQQKFPTIMQKSDFKKRILSFQTSLRFASSPRSGTFDRLPGNRSLDFEFCIQYISATASGEPVRWLHCLSGRSHCAGGLPLDPLSWFGGLGAGGKSDYLPTLPFSSDVSTNIATSRFQTRLDQFIDEIIFIFKVPYVF